MTGRWGRGGGHLGVETPRGLRWRDRLRHPLGVVYTVLDNRARDIAFEWCVVLYVIGNRARTLSEIGLGYLDFTVTDGDRAMRWWEQVMGFKLLGNGGTRVIAGGRWFTPAVWL